MEQSNGSTENNVVLGGCVWSQNERDVAGILLEMADMMLDLDSDLKIPFQWGRKRKRSAIQRDPVHAFPQRLSYSPTTTVLENGGSDGGDSGVAAAAMVKAKARAEASSPATPLSLSLTESDEKPNNNNKDNDKPLRIKASASLKKKKDYYLKTIEDLTERKTKLNQEIEKVIDYRDRLKAYNLKLKEKQLELRNGPKYDIQKHKCQIQELVHAPHNFSSNFMAENPQQHQKKRHCHDESQSQFEAPTKRVKLKNCCEAPQLCSIEHLSMQPYSCSPSPPPPTPNGPLTLVNTTNTNASTSNCRGPLGARFLDLNAPPEEAFLVDSYQPLDEVVANQDISRFKAAQARKRRIEINRTKNTIGNNTKPRYSYKS